MIGRLLNPLMAKYLDHRWVKLLRFRESPRPYQERTLQHLLNKGAETSFGRDHDFQDIRGHRDFAEAIPIREYDDFASYLDRVRADEKDLLWPGRTRLFSKSSGTTARSKYIPVTPENLRKSHLKGSWDSMAILYHHQPRMDVFRERSLVLPGSLETMEGNPRAKAGDISALLIDHMPTVARPFYEPDFELALSPDWEQKIEKVAQRALSTPNVVLFAGVPTWNIVLFRRILEITGRDHMLEVWPQLKAYFHGGVGFGPYRGLFEELIPREDFVYQEIYNASEGLFAIQDVQSEDLGMLLLLTNGIFFEFIDLKDYNVGRKRAVPLWEVEQGRDYVMVISTNAGLWRYVVGDVVRFSTILPYRVRVVGRTSQFINAFGEELMVHNAEMALREACTETQSILKDYTVAPKYLGIEGSGCHEWYIEWERAPEDIEYFAQILDRQLCRLNSDYDAKRSQNLALSQLRIQSVPRGSFRRWLEHRGRVGSQTKVPRLSNDRKNVEEFLEVIGRRFV